MGGLDGAEGMPGIVQPTTALPANAYTRLATDDLGRLILSPESFDLIGVFRTLAEAEAAPGPAILTASMILETGSVYVFEPNATYTIDHVVILGHTGGSPGRWVHQGSTLALAPLGGGQDDAAHVETILAGNAGKRRTLLGTGAVSTLPAIWDWQTPCTVPSESIVDIDPDCRIVSTIPGSTFADACFLAVQGAAIPGTSTTLSADAPLGTSVLHVTAAGALAADQLLIISNANGGNSPGLRVSTNAIESIVATTIILKRPLERAFVAGDDLSAVLSLPTNIQINANGAHFSGTGARAVELAFAQNCAVRGVNVDPVDGMFSDLAISFDVGGFNNVGENCVIESDGTGFVGIALESNDFSRIVSCHVSAFGQGYGIINYDGAQCEVIASSGDGAAVAGIAFTSDTSIQNAGTQGCVACKITDSSGTGSIAGAGLLLFWGTIDSQIVNSSFDGNNVGIQNGDGTTHCYNNFFQNVTAKGNQTLGFSGAQNTDGVNVEGIDISNNGSNAATGTGISCASPGSFKGVRSSGGNGASLATFNATNVHLDDWDCSHTQTIFVVSLLGVGNVYEVHDCRIRAGLNSGCFTTEANASFSGTTLANSGGSGIGVATTPGGCVRIEDGNHWDGCANPTFVNGGGVFSQGVVTLNGTTPVAVSFPDLQSTDHARLTLKAVHGTGTGLFPVIAYTPGTGFTAKSTAVGDTSDWEYGIEP